MLISLEGWEEMLELENKAIALSLSEAPGMSVFKTNPDVKKGSAEGYWHYGPGSA
jgi:hypothetical protein